MGRLAKVGHANIVLKAQESLTPLLGTNAKILILHIFFRQSPAAGKRTCTSTSSQVLGAAAHSSFSTVIGRSRIRLPVA